MSNGNVALFHSKAGRNLVLSKCRAEGLDPKVLERLVAVEIKQQGKLKKRGITSAFDEIFDSIEVEEGE